jgi:hypothetical protein
MSDNSGMSYALTRDEQRNSARSQRVSILLVGT